MSVVLDSARLGFELAVRGWSNVDLAQRAGISPPTVTAALRGHRIAPRSLRLIATALAAHPPLDGAERLLSARCEGEPRVA